MRTGSRSVFTVNGFVAAQICVGFLNNAVIAAFFGLTQRIDAYFAASQLPALFMSLSIDYLGRNFLPAFTRAAKQSPATAAELTSSVVTIVFLAASALALLISALGGRIFALMLPGFSGPDVELVTRYFWIMAPAIVLMSVNAFHEYVCQHDEKFVHVVAIRTALPLTALSSVVVLGPTIGEYSLPLGFLLGHCVVFGLMARTAGYRYRPRLAVRKEWEGKVFTSSAVMMGSGLLARTRGLIGTYLASQLGAGSIAALAFAWKLTEPLERSAFTGLRMLVFSRSTKLFAAGNTNEVGRIYELGLKAAFLCLVPVIWWVGLNGLAIVSLLFMRGEFDATMARLVAAALTGLIPSVVLFGVTGMLSNAFYAMERVAVPALVMPLGTLVYLLLAPALGGSLGVLGLALATSLSAGLLFLIMLALLSRRVAPLGGARALLAFGVYNAIAGTVFATSHWSLGSAGLHGVVVAASDLALGLTAYAGILLLLKDPTLRHICSIFRRREAKAVSLG